MNQSRPWRRLTRVSQDSVKLVVTRVYGRRVRSQQQDNSTAAPWSKDITINSQGLFTTSLFSLVAQA